MNTYKNLLGDYHENEGSYVWRMLVIGFATNVHWDVMLGFTDYLFQSYGFKESFRTFEVIFYGFITLATIANARYMLTIEHIGRFKVTQYLFVISYFFFSAAFIMS